MDISEYAGVGGFPLVVGLVEAVKRAFPDLEARWYPLLAIALGIVLSVGLAVILGTDPAVAVVTGVVSGLSAAGLYSGTKATVVEPRREAPRG